MKGKNSINNHLTQHYNKYHNSFGYKPDSQNQKTVLLKIGERPSIDISTKEYFDNLPRKKQKILKQIHGESLTPTEISKIIEQQFLKLQQLDTALCKYTELKDKYMQELWNKQGKDQTSFQKIKEFTDIDEELIKQHIKYYDAIKKNQTKIAQSIGNPRLADKLHTIIRDNLKDQISSTYFHKKFMANLWSDVATDYLGYLIKFQKSIEEFKETKLKVIDSLKDINQELNLAINPFQNSGKDKAHLSKAWTILQAEFSGNTKKGYSSFSMRLTYDEYNLRYSKIKSALNVLCQSQDIEESLKSFNLRSFLESYKNGKITRINFDHNQTFPWNNKPKLTPIELVTELNELITKYNQDTNKPQTKSYYNKKTNQKKTKPIELDLKKSIKTISKLILFKSIKKVSQ
ncbi:hypothetical protein HC864_02740 [Candidatus Gracilibacteria bacterium]|nr:hypothetical protein [Candidatus Gracilibacteria bacterium]